MKQTAHLPERQWLRAALPGPFVFLVSLLLSAACAHTEPPSEPAPPAPSSSSARSSVELVLLGTTDVHGWLYPHDYYTGERTDHGLALLAPVIDSVRAAHPGRTYLFDSGDLLQGTPIGLVYASGGEIAGVEADAPNAIIEAMNQLGYDASAIGNHEFNYGLEHLGDAIEQADFPFVASNVYRHGTDEPAYRPYALLPHVVGAGDTLWIGVTGNTPPGVHLWDHQHVEGVLEFGDIVASLERTVGEMRARGADLVVVLSHGGLEGTSYDTAATGLTPENVALRVAREVPGVDVIFLGHTHRERADTTVTGAANPHGVLMTQAGEWARSLAVATVRLERTAGGWSAVEASGSLLRPDPAHADTAFLDSLRWAHERTLEFMRSRAGRSTARWEARTSRVEDTPILDLINEVQLRATGADLSSTAAFTLRAAIPEGEVSVADLAGLYIYDNTLKVVRITGAQLRAYLEKTAEYYHGWPAQPGRTVTNFDVPGYNFDVVSGVDYTIDVSRPLGERITELRYRGEPVRDDQSFTLALNNYRQSGAGGYTMLADAPVVYDRQENIRDLLIEEVRSRGTIRPEEVFERNWRLMPEAAARAALEEQTAREGLDVAQDDDVVAPARAGGAGHAGAAPRPRLRVLATNDVHGQLGSQTPVWGGGRSVGGAAVLSTYFAHERAGFDGPTLLLDGGDVMQGTPVSNLTHGRATVEAYNTIGYAAAAIGNHEFDWGVDVLRERIDDANYPWLAANIVVAGSDTAPSWVQPVELLEVEGVRVGLIGLATQETPEKTRATHVEGLDFLDGAAAIDRWVPELRRRGADFVIVVAHAGAECEADGTICEGEIVDWARAVEEKPDLIVAGHTHQWVRTRVAGIPIVEAASQGARYAVVDLEQVTADSVSSWIRGVPVAWADAVRPDTVVAGVVARHEAEAAPLIERVVTTLAERLGRGTPTGTPGSALERLGDYPLGRLIVDAQRSAGATGIAFMNNGGIRINLEAGPVTWGDLFQLQPFENRLYRLVLTGSQLREAVEHAVSGPAPSAHVSGLVAWYDPARSAGSRVLTLELESGEPVHADRLYPVIVNDFLAEGGDGFSVFTRALSREETGITDLDALVDYLEELPEPVRAPAEPRLRPTITDDVSSPRSRTNDGADSGAGSPTHGIATYSTRTP